MKRKLSRTSIAMARRWRAATVHVAIVLMAIGRLEEIVADVVDVPAAAVVDEIVDAADAVDVQVAADGIADAVGRAGEGTKRLSPTDLHGSRK
jgi:hypothetical protein